ncbi:MAG: helix-turn-helix transcriptional regulator [Lachnospiraceae bacterium]|nr:helix-turn-helix transcriptional regulator [Lachnospiraceae bacterium]
MEDYREDERFGYFLKEHRIKYTITLEQLSEGLCSASELARIETGTRVAGKALQDRLLQRLGISPDVYECLLFQEDYIPWKKRQQLLYLTAQGSKEEAYRLLEEYREQYEVKAEKDVDRRLERQFCLSMEAQLLQSEDVTEVSDGMRQQKKRQQEKAGDLFREALELTVNSPSEGISGRICSVQELNLLLEWIHHESPQNWEEYYREILYQIADSRFDAVSRAKIYPKAVYYLCRDGLAMGNWGLEEKAEGLTLCEEAMDRLREAGRMYYLWEILGLSAVLAREIAAGQRAAGAPRKAEEAEKKIQRWREQAEALEAVHGEFGVPVETRDFCWLYVEKEVYCINDVIRIRREMLGITRKQLCDDGILCSEKTLRRLENGRKKIQKGILRELLGRLRLSAESCRTELVTSDPEAVKLMRKAWDQVDNWESEEADLLLGQLKERISLEVPSNRQAWLRCQAVNEVHKGTITGEQCIEKIREALECTLPWEAAMKLGEKYLTNEEISCILGMVSWKKEMDEEKKRQLVVLEEQYGACEREKLIFCFINMYEIVMGGVASELGNMGEYDHSDVISRNIIRECLYQRRTFGVHGGIYGMMWNNAQRQKEGIPIRQQQNPEKDLRHCIIFSELGMEKHDMEFYRRKLQSGKGT